VGRNDPNVDVLKLVSDWLADESNGEWAMVLDNVDHSEIFGPSGNDSDTSPRAGLNAYLPQSSNGSILVTSRNKDVAYRLVGAYSLITEIRPMNEGEGRQLLRNKLGDVSKEDDTGEFLDALGHLPIAISQAAAYISRRAHMTMAGYLKELRMNSEKKRSLLDWDAGDLRRDESASNSVVAILQMSLNRIQQERPSAAELLSLMSFFNPQSIPEAALRRYLKGIGNSEGMDDELRRFEVDLDVLRAYSLVTATAGTDMCEMHVLVQYCTRLWLSSLGQAKRWQSAFVDLMTREFPMPTYGNWALCQQLLPHVEHLVANEPDDPAMMKAWAQLLHDAATYMQMKGSYDEAHKIAIKALVARERVLGREQESTLESVNLLARILQDQARLAEAEEYDQRILSARRRLLGDGHELTLQSMANFGTVLQDQGRYDEAEKLYRQALEGRRKKLGDMHLDTAQSMNCLAMVLQAKARYGEGQRVHRQMFEGMQGMDTERLADTILSSDSVSLIQYNEAQTLYRLALKAKRQELGDEHPHTLTSMSNLAAALLDQEKYDEAEVLIRRVVKGRQQLGEEHPDRLTALDILARVLGAQHKFEEAEVNSRQALEGRTKRLGEHHPDTLTSLNNLAALLMWMERYEDAAKYFQSAITGLDRSLGPRHPFTIACRSNSEILRSLEQKAHRAQKGSLYAWLRARWRVKGF
jgi:tetratricopeptide (TPR) repeat protein